MIAAAVVETQRKENMGFVQVVGDEKFFASNITVFLQIPQFALVGASEAFTSIAGVYVVIGAVELQWVRWSVVDCLVFTGTEKHASLCNDQWSVYSKVDCQQQGQGQKVWTLQELTALPVYIHSHPHHVMVMF